MMPESLRDLRVALRSLLKAPGFVIVTVLTLALGLGGISLIASLIPAIRATRVDPIDALRSQ